MKATHTIEELELMARHHKKTDYTMQDKAELIHLIIKYVNPYQNDCIPCINGETLRAAKDALNEFYLRYRDEIIALHNNTPEVETELERAKKQVKSYTRKKKTIGNGRARKK